MKEEISIVGDVEDFEEQQDKEFSHQALIMRAMNKCLKAGSQEMRAGFMTTKADRLGNETNSYVDDTRKVFVSSVNTLKIMMLPDFDDDARDNIKSLLKKLKKIFQELLNEEIKDWEKTTIFIKKQRLSNGIVFRKGCLHKDLPYYEEFINKEVEIYQEIMEELSLLTGRKGFYVQEDYREDRM